MYLLDLIARAEREGRNLTRAEVLAWRDSKLGGDPDDEPEEEAVPVLVPEQRPPSEDFQSDWNRGRTA